MGDFVQTLNVREMRMLIGQLDKVLAEKGEIVLTRHGKPVARVLPIGNARQRPSHADIRSTMPRLEVPSSELIRAERDES